MEKYLKSVQNLPAPSWRGINYNPADMISTEFPSCQE
jgi:hypothetical protein